MYIKRKAMSTLDNLRSVKVAGIALFDVIATGVALTPVFSRFNVDWWRMWALILPIGVVSHVLAGVSTPFTNEVMAGEITIRTIVMTAWVVAALFA